MATTERYQIDRSAPSGTSTNQNMLKRYVARMASTTNKSGAAADSMQSKNQCMHRAIAKKQNLFSAFAMHLHPSKHRRDAPEGGFKCAYRASRAGLIRHHCMHQIRQPDHKWACTQGAKFTKNHKTQHTENKVRVRVRGAAPGCANEAPPRGD